jgi:hypothetical protein
LTAAKRTVSFFRVCLELDSTREVRRLPDCDWQSFLAEIASFKVSERTYEGPTRRLIGEVLTVDNEYALKLMEPRDENSWLEILRQENSAEPFDPAAIGELVETTVVDFLSTGNIVGIIRGSMSSPTHTALAEWLENIKIGGHKLFEDPKGIVRAEPALAKSQRVKLDAADGASMTSLRISTSMADEVRAAGSEIVGDTLLRLKRKYGEIFVTVTLRVPRGKAYDAARAELKEEAVRVQSVAGAAESASATLITYDVNSRARQEEIDFVAQRITAKKTVPLMGENGQPIRNTSAVLAIREAAKDLQDELRNS